MFKKVIIKKTVYTIDCDLGTQDVSWLAMSACLEHGLNSYPVSRYVPCLATNKEGEILHPKLVICKYDKKIGDEIYVKIRNKATDFEEEMSKEELQWYDQAFNNDRFFMELKVRLVPSNELKRDYLFRVILNYKIHPSIAVFFPGKKEEISVDLEEIGNKNKNELYQGVIKIPIGSADYSKLIFKDKDGIEKDTMDTKNKITVERFPEPLLVHEREILIRQKEEVIKNKEVNLRQNIKQIEEEKLTEEIRLKQLQEFLMSLPFSLDEIFEYTNKEIQDAQKDLIAIFAFLEKDEYLIFKKLFEIFNDYSKFYDEAESQTETIDVEALMSFFKNYVDHKKEDLSTIISDFQKFYISRIENLTEYNFLDFVFTVIYLLYNIQIYKTIVIENEFSFIYVAHQDRTKDEIFKAIYTDKSVSSKITKNIEFLKRLFMNFSTRKFESYYEMSPTQYLNFAKEFCLKKGFDMIPLIEKKFAENICFFDFLEKIVWMANILYKDNEDELCIKVGEICENLENIYAEDFKDK